MARPQPTRRGFTIIEAIVALVVLSVLVTAGAAGYRAAVHQVHERALAVSLRSIDQEARALARNAGRVDPRPFLTQAAASLELPGDVDVTAGVVETSVQAGYVTIRRYSKCATLLADPDGGDGRIVQHVCGSPPVTGGGGGSCVAPSAPLSPDGSGTATVAVDDNKVRVEWDAPSVEGSGVDGYRVLLATSTNTSVFDVTDPDVGEPQGVRTYATITGLTNGTTYQVSVVAYSGGCDSAALGPRAATPRDTDAPSWPSSTPLTATAVPNAIELEWRAPTDDDVDSYAVERSTASTGPWSALAGGLTGRTLTDDNGGSGLPAGTTYHYRVQATDTSNNISAWSNVASAAATANTVPAGVTATVSDRNASGGSNDITVAWESVSGSVSAYNLYRCKGRSCLPATLVASVGAATTSVDDLDLAEGSWTYWVTSEDASSVESNPSSPETATVTFPPASPSGLTVTAGDVNGSGGSNDLTLTWSAPADADLASYRVLRCSGSGCTPTSVVSTPAPSGGASDSWVDLDRPAGTWTYAVEAVDDQGNRSAPSTPAAATVN